VYALDPDKQGEKLWEVRIGMGSALGGVEWGMAADRTHHYVAVNQGTEQEGVTIGPGHSLTALNLMDGSKVWQHVAPTGAGVCTWQASCNVATYRGGGYSGPPTLANGVLYGVNIDGHVRAFTAADGKMIWDFNTGAQKYQTVNGVKDQRGGNLDATGITFAGDMAFLMAGFSSFSSSAPPDNVLLAFSVDGK
ncbi:MAG: PQQ-binding-like beta-propeller repeat protein, partial [Alphaproteobacteria bacterium]